MNISLLFWIIEIKKKVCTRKCHVLFQKKKTLLTNQIHLENEWNACVIHYKGVLE